MRARFSTTWKGARDQLAKASCTHRELGHRASGQITGREPVRARHLRRRRGHSSASARTSRRLAGQQGARREERGRQHAREQDGRWRPSGRCGKLREPSRSSGTTEHGRLWQLIIDCLDYSVRYASIRESRPGQGRRSPPCLCRGACHAVAPMGSHSPAAIYTCLSAVDRSSGPSAAEPKGEPCTIWIEGK